jgi:hypothetical protein
MDKTADQLRRLEAARKQLQETEDLGDNILANLSIQREQLEKARANSKEIAEEQRVSMTLLARMSKWWRG